jgi:hypothetical protein
VTACGSQKRGRLYEIVRLTLDVFELLHNRRVIVRFPIAKSVLNGPEAQAVQSARTFCSPVFAIQEQKIARKLSALAFAANKRVTTFTRHGVLT